MTRLSHSAREKYEQCPYKYYLHYVEGLRNSTPQSALVFGGAFDLALNEMLSQGSVDYHKVFDDEWSKYKDVFIDCYKSDLNEDLLTDEEKLLSLQQRNYLSMLHKGHLMLDAYAADILPKIKKVISIQDAITLEGSCDDGLESFDTITGVLDLIAIIEHNGEDKHAILDNKTTSEPYAKNSVLKKDQLALYASAFPEIEYQGYLTVNKKNFKTQILVDKIPEEKKQEVLDKFITAIDNIKDEKFDKNKKSCWAFSKRCEFWRHCNGDGEFDSNIYKKEEGER